VVSLEPYKYLHNLFEMPGLLVLLLAGVVLVLFGLANDLLLKPGKGIWFTGSGTVITVFTLFLMLGYNNTCFYPSEADLQSSLHIRNSSSSEFTLTIMSYVSLIIPFVMAYIWIAWRSINKKKIDKEELKSDNHIY
jgi:cytochrome d ubiquinol oxidase subunit II